MSKELTIKDGPSMGRRQMLKTLGIAAGVAYVAPAMLQLSQARASGGSFSGGSVSGGSFSGGSFSGARHRGTGGVAKGGSCSTPARRRVGGGSGSFSDARCDTRHPRLRSNGIQRNNIFRRLFGSV